ncbi:SMI1/KNR4 family protein [Planctomycetota bacterium]|nr:SMI1/KNR4 family protein [Planctomycetota bacterium]
MPYPLEEKYIIKTEEKLGAKFPNEYRNKMMASNGGEIEADDDDWQLNPIFDDSDKKRLSRTCNDIIRETSQAREWPDFPSNAVSIAQNGCGDHIVLLINKNAVSDKFYTWYHDDPQLVEVELDW